MKMGREEPAISMDVTGKIVWAKHAEIQQANVKTLSSTASDSSTYFSTMRCVKYCVLSHCDLTCDYN